MTPAENFVSPLSESSPPRKQLKKKKRKKSVSPHDSLAVLPDPSERSPTLPSSSGLCVQQIENEQQSTVGEVSQPLEVMALARRLAGPDNAVPSLNNDLRKTLWVTQRWFYSFQTFRRSTPSSVEKYCMESVVDLCKVCKVQRSTTDSIQYFSTDEGVDRRNVWKE